MEETKKSNGLAIASFVLALVWGVLCLTIIGGLLGVICWILAFIFAIVALCKKQGSTRASIIWLIISLLWIIVTIIWATFIWKVWNEHKDDIVTPITDFATWVDENPEIADLMKNEEFSDKFNEVLEQRLSEKYNEDIKDVEDLDGLIEIWNGVFEEVKATLVDLSNQEVLPEAEVEEEVIEEPAIEEITEEIVEEVVEETAEEVVEETVEETVE